MKRFISSLFIILFMSSTLYMTNFFNSVAQLVIIAINIMILMTMLILKDKRLSINVVLFILATLIFCATLISGIVNQDLGSVAASFGSYIIYLSLMVMYHRLYRWQSLPILFRIILISQLPLISTVMFYGNSFPLTGIFYNPNSFGITCATLYVVLLSYLVGNIVLSISKHVKILTSKTMLSVIGCILLLLLTIGAQSRTSLLAEVFITLFSVAIVLVKSLTSKRIKIISNTFFATIIAPIFLWLVYEYTFIKDYVYMHIVYKFNQKASTNNLLSERNFIWNQVLKDAKIFGNGSGYFEQRLGIGAHNTFMGYLGEYGWIMVSLFIVFVIISTIYAMRFAIRDKNIFRFLPLYLIGAFIMLSMGEIMNLKAIMLAMYCAIGVISTPHYEVEIVNNPNITKKRFNEELIN